MSDRRWPWKPEQVGTWMKQVWGYDPKARFEGRALQTLEIRNWPALYLPRRDQARLQDVVRAWAWCLGTREMSFRAMCDRRGWNQSAANREVKIALQLIADGLNREAERADTAAATSVEQNVA